MATTVNAPASPLRAAIAMLPRVSGRAWGWALAGGAALGGAELAWRCVAGPGPGPSLPLILGISTAVALVSTYGASMAMIGARAALPGGVRFAAVTALLWSPMLAGVALLFSYAGAPEQAVGLPSSLSLALLLGGLLFAAWLSAWPVAQALSAELVDPVELFRATRGHRWSLLALNMMPTMLHAIDLPAIAEAPTIAQAALRFAPAAMLAAFDLLLQALVVFAAWSFFVAQPAAGGADR